MPALCNPVLLSPRPRSLHELRLRFLRKSSCLWRPLVVERYRMNSRHAARLCSPPSRRIIEVGSTLIRVARAAFGRRIIVRNDNAK